MQQLKTEITIQIPETHVLVTKVEYEQLKNHYVDAKRRLFLYELLKDNDYLPQMELEIE